MNTNRTTNRFEKGQGLVVLIAALLIIVLLIWATQDAGNGNYIMDGENVFNQIWKALEASFAGPTPAWAK